MTNWLNPRVFAVAISLIVMVQVSKIGDPHTTIRNDWLACALMLLLYAVVFLVPLQRCFGWRTVVGPAALLLLSWLSVAIALVSDALPVTLYVQLQRRFNWPMIAFCTAGFAGFFLFFTHMARSFALRDEVLEARGERSR
jgi:hypothetical protein